MAGRKPKEIPLVEIIKMGRLNATTEEMAGHFEVNEKTMYRIMERKAYSDAFEKGLADFKLTLRRSQVLGAQAGNPTMLIWLGKQYLGQKDKPDSSMSGGDKLHEMLEIFKAGPAKPTKRIAPKEDDGEPVG